VGVTELDDLRPVLADALGASLDELSARPGVA